MIAPTALVSMILLPWLAQDSGAPGQAPPVDAAASDERALTPAEIGALLIGESEAKPGPLLGVVGRMAEIQVPEGLHFADARGAKRLLEMTGNVPGEDTLAAVLAYDETSDWFVIFAFDESGYVEDEEKDELDADDLLDSMRAGQEQGNEMRKQRGLDTLEILGWEKPPFYDPRTNNLTWATRLRSSSGGEAVNWDVRLLGRTGVMSVGLVIDPEDLQAALPRFDQLIEGFAYGDGHKYAQFLPGDKVAEYGLGALVLGGAGVAAAKLGFLSKFWKFIVFGVLAAGAFLKNAWGKLFRRSRGARGARGEDGARESAES